MYPRISDLTTSISPRSLGGRGNVPFLSLFSLPENRFRLYCLHKWAIVKKKSASSRASILFTTSSYSFFISESSFQSLILFSMFSYINIVIHEGDNIVGYALVEIYTNDLENEPAQTYSAKLLKSVSFPKANREYQKITAEYVATEMEQIKNETQAGQRW